MTVGRPSAAVLQIVALGCSREYGKWNCRHNLVVADAPNYMTRENVTHSSALFKIVSCLVGVASAHALGRVVVANKSGAGTFFSNLVVVVGCSVVI